MEDDKPEPENEHEQSFHGGSDICQQLMDRYAKSAAPQHRHLLATAAAMRSLLAGESLPLSPAAYFAAAISAAADSLSSPLDPSAAAALLSFLAIALPLVPPRGVEPSPAAEATAVMARILARDVEQEKGGKGLGAASVRAGVKCLGVLVGFCDLGDWDSVKLGFETLMNFSVDKRPKVRRCSQECLEKVFKSLNCSVVIKEASKLVMTMLESYMPLAVELSTSGASSKSKNDTSSESKNVEVLHMLNMLKLTVPFLSMKTRSKVLSELNKITKRRFSALTRHIFKIIETCFETSKVDAIMPVTENILVSLSSYISLRNKNPPDTVISSTTLLKQSLDLLHDGKSSSHSKSRNLVFDSVAGLLTSEAPIASHASTILKELINSHVDSSSLVINDNQFFEDERKEGTETISIKSCCTILETCLKKSDGKPNEYILAVISALFLKLGGVSYYYMKNIMLKLADAMTQASGGSKYNICHLEKCIGSAVVAMGPEKILTVVPITLNTDDLTCSNIWLVPILKNYVVGASLEYYIQHILRLAKSFKEASRQVKRTTIGRNLQDHAHSLWGLLPFFCRYPTDLYQNVGPLSEVLIKFLKKDSLMQENVAVSLQVLVNQNKNALNQKTNAGDSQSFEVIGSLVEFNNLPTYSKKIATKNLKALASYSTALLEALIDLFIDSPPVKRAMLKDAIGCLACITDSSVTKKILMSLFERFRLIDDNGEFKNSENQEELIDEEQHGVKSMEKDAERCVIMELASSFVEGAKEDLIDRIYNFIKHSFQVTDGIGHQQAYYTLSRVLEEHAWFCSSHSIELIDLLLGFKPPTYDSDTLSSRFACFHPLVVYLLKIDSQEENSKAFLIVNEIILMLKDAKEEDARKVAYDILLKISSSLRGMPSSSSDSAEAPYQKLITMIMGYLSGASPHVKSGAVSALSMLIYSDASICLSVPDLIPTILSLLQNKSLEVIKAALGFVKVLVSCLQARDLQNLLSSVVKGVLPWSAVSRNHFKSKVTVIMEILIRKCGISAVESVTPDKYTSFVKSVVESRQNKNSKDTTKGDTETKNEEQPATRQEKRKRKDSDAVPEKAGSVKHRRRTDNNSFANKSGSKESNMSTDAGGARRNNGAGRFSKEKFTKGRSESSGGPNRKSFNRGPQSGGQKRKMNTGTKDRAVQRPAGGSKFGNGKKLGRK